LQKLIFSFIQPCLYSSWIVDINFLSNPAFYGDVLYDFVTHLDRTDLLFCSEYLRDISLSPH